MRKKFSLVYSLLLGTIATTTLAGCGSSEVEKRFTVSLIFEDSKGVVLVDKSEGVLNDDTTVTISISPKEGYEIDTVKINNTDVVAKKKITFTPKENENLVQVTFSEVQNVPEVEKFNVKLDYDKTKGDVKSDVTEGEIGKVERVNLEIKPKEGFEILSVRHNNKELVFSGTSASFIPVVGENLIKVDFKEVEVPERTFNVVTEYDENEGTVEVDNPNGTLESIEKVNVTIKANDGYEILSIEVNGETQEVKETFSFKPIEGENTVKVTFKALPVETKFNVKTEFDATKGNVTVDVLEGILENTEKVNVIITTKPGFVINNISINDEVIETVSNTLSFAPRAGENIVKVIFADEVLENDFEVVIEEYDTSKGTVVTDIKEGIVENTDQVTITVTPNEGYELSEIIANGSSLKIEGNKAKFKPIKGVNNVSVTFSEKSVEERFTVVTDFDSSKGNVFTDVQEGALSEVKEVTVVAIPKEGYEINKIIANGIELEITNNNAKFAPQIGVNKVSVTFKEIVVEERFNIEVITPTFGNAKVTLSKNEGLVGEEVTFEVTYLTSRFEIEDILLNGQSIGKEARSFTPVAGTNTLEIKLTATQIVPAIDQGNNFNDVTRSETSDLSSSEEVIQIVFDKIEAQISNKGATEHARKIVGAYAKQFNLYEQVFKKYGITKNDINMYYDVVVTPEFIEILNSTLQGEALTNALAKQFYRIISDLFARETRMDKFVGFTSTTIFVAVSMIYGQEYGYKLANYYDYQNANGDLGIFSNRIINSSKPTNAELDKLFGMYETIGQFIFTTIGKSEKVKTPESLEKFFNLFKRIGLGFVNGGSQRETPLTEDEIYEIVVLIEDVFNKNFLSKEGFIKFINKLYSFGDVAHLHLKLFAHTNMGEKLYVTNAYQNVIDVLNANKEEAYYLIRILGLFARETRKQDITDVMYVFSDTNKFEAKQLAQILIILARRFDAVKLSYSQSSNAVKSIKNMGAMIIKLSFIIMDGTLPESITSTLDLESVVNELPKFKDKRFDLDSDVNEVIPFAQNLIDSASNSGTSNNIYNHKIAISVNKTNYILGETTFLVSASYDDKDISKELNIEGFDTTEEGYFVAKITYKEYTFFKTYTVTKNGIGLNEEELKIPVLKLDSDPNLFDKSFTFSDKVTKKFSEFDATNKSEIDTKTKGLKTGWINYCGNYYYFSYEVR